MSSLAPDMPFDLCCLSCYSCKYNSDVFRFEKIKMWDRMHHLSVKTLSKRKAWVAALRNFILRYALSLEEPTVLMMNLWKICYNNTTRKPPSSADGASLRQQKLFQRFQMVFTHSRNTRENPFCTQLIHDSRLRLPSPVLGLRTYMWKGRNTAKNSRKPKSFPSARVRWRGQRRPSPRFPSL